MIAKFTLVQIFSTQAGLVGVRPWTPSAYEEPTLTTGPLVFGVTMTSSVSGDPLEVMKTGYMRDVARQNGETWAVGDILYAKANGSITKTRPAGPLPQVIVGTVFETIGSLHTVAVDVRVLPSIMEMSGVTREAPVNLDVLIYNGTTHAYVPRQIDHGSDLAGIADDDHAQYLKEKASGGTAAEVPAHNHSSDAEGGPINHRRWSSMMGD